MANVAYHVVFWIGAAATILATVVACEALTTAVWADLEQDAATTSLALVVNHASSSMVPRATGMPAGAL